MAAQKRKQHWWQKFFAFLNVYLLTQSRTNPGSKLS